MEKLPINEVKVRMLIKQCRHLNIFPAFLDHYYPKKKAHPVSELLAELIDECVQYLSIMTKAEIDKLVDSLPPGIKFFIDLKGSVGRDDILLQRIAFKYLVALVQQDYLSFKDVVTSNESEVLKVYPELKQKLDKDGLIYIDDDFILADGGIAYKDHILHYHQFLRRGFQSNPNFDFLGAFIAYFYLTGSENQFRVAIDHHRIMPKEFYQRIVEMDTWHGLRFDEANLDDPNAVGLTIVKRTKPSYFEMFSHDLDRTEFYWGFNKGIKTFEVEEVSGEAALFGPYHLNRYVHSERDISLKTLLHFDGAVKVYLQNGYKDRLGSFMPTEFKSYKKVKLFRIDGNINVKVWIELISLFFKMNEMIIEYFNPKQFEEMFGEKIKQCKTYKEESLSNTNV